MMKQNLFRVSFALFFAVCGLSSCRTRPVEPICDLPSLIGQPIDVVKLRLGIPQVEAAPAAASPTNQTTWKKDDVTLIANWKTGSKRITDWTLISLDDAHAVREEETAALMRPGQLKQGDPRYSLDWIEATDRPLFYKGVKITPAPQNHNVVLRVSGASALVQATYQIGGAQPKNDSILTVTPWEISAVVADDSQASLSASPYKNLSSGPFEIKVEIVSDGKVVASDTSVGGTVQCQYDW